MYSHTKKVGSMGKYGPRIGRKIRSEIEKIERQSKRPFKCPQCGKKGVKRRSAGIWQCRSCQSSFSGGTFLFSPRGEKKEV
ncbi:50S ribosomal protein L37ae [Candidatus Altiarchaeota archaeon]